MPDRKLVAVPCRLAPGMFSSERLFKVRMANEEFYESIAPSHFCWNGEGKLVGENEPAEEADGMIAARIVSHLDDQQVALELPDGEVVAVRKEEARDRPTEIRPPVPESARHVPFGS